MRGRLITFFIVLAFAAAAQAVPAERVLVLGNTKAEYKTTTLAKSLLAKRQSGGLTAEEEAALTSVGHFQESIKKARQKLSKRESEAAQVSPQDLNGFVDVTVKELISILTNNDAKMNFFAQALSPDKPESLSNEKLQGFLLGAFSYIPLNGDVSGGAQAVLHEIRHNLDLLIVQADSKGSMAINRLIQKDKMADYEPKRFPSSKRH